MVRKLSVIFLLILQIIIMTSSVAFAWTEDFSKDKNAHQGGSAATMHMPVPDGSWTMTSPFGWRTHPIYGTRKFHSGIDFGVDYGTEVSAAQSGTVTYAGWISGYGNAVIIDHGNGITTLYGHNQSLAVSEGDSVTMGQVIAYAGSTGNSTGPHCHFEVRINDDPVDPGLFLGDAIEQEELAQGMEPDGKNGDLIKSLFKNATFEVSVDFAKPMKEVIDKTVEVIQAAFGKLQDALFAIFFALAVIDLAIAAMYKSLGAWGQEDDTTFVNWFVYKIIFYALMAFVLSNFQTFVGNLALYGFPAMGVKALGMTAEQVGNAVSDPTAVIQKGMQIVTPVMNEALKLHGILDIPAKGLMNFICLICGVILILLFLLIGLQIMFAYLYFYFTVLFAFTQFMFSGLRFTRKYASNGINGIFAASLNLMFFCFFSVLVTTCMANIDVGPLVETQTTHVEAGQKYTPPAGTISSGGSSSGVDISGRPKADVALRVQQILKEKYGYDFRADLIWAQMAQESGSDFDSYLALNCHNYSGMREHGDAGMTDDGYGIYSSDESYAQSYAYTLSLFARDNGLDKAQTPEEYAQALKEGGYMGAGAEEYAAGMERNLNGSSNVTHTIVYIYVLLKLILLCLMFILFGDHMMKMINKTFGGMGFKLTNEQPIG